MKPLALLSLVTLLFVVGCRDLRKDHVPTEVENPGADVPAATGEGPVGVSTVCLVYDAQLTRARSALEGNASDASAQAEVTALEIVIADACN